MEGNVVELQWVLGGISAVVATLSAAVSYLFKLYYLDTKQALIDCKEGHKNTKVELSAVLPQEKADCKGRTF